MNIVRKKVWKKYFEQIMAGTKKFELRLADFDIAPGDTLILEEWDQEKQEYTGRRLSKTVTYVLKTKDVSFWSPSEIDKHGFQIIQFEQQ